MSAEDLAAWLTQIWDDDERIARAIPDLYRSWEALREGPGAAWIDCVSSSRTQSPGLLDPDDAAHIARHDPASILARIAADRQILAECSIVLEDKSPERVQERILAWAIVRHLASAHRDRPGWREAWQ